MRADWGEELTVDLWRFHCGCERRGAANSGADGAVGTSDPIGSAARSAIAIQVGWRRGSADLSAVKSGLA